LEVCANPGKVSRCEVYSIARGSAGASVYPASVVADRSLKEESRGLIDISSFLTRISRNRPRERGRNEDSSLSVGWTLARAAAVAEETAVSVLERNVIV